MHWEKKLMSIEIKVPVLPESVADATIVLWYKKPGEAVKRDEKLVDLETDKVVLEVPAPEDGVLQEVLRDTGAIVVSGELLGSIEAGAIAAQQPIEAVTKTMAKTIAKTIATELSPAVRRIVTEKGIDVSQIKGSGKGGRILKQDVEEPIQLAAQPTATTPATITTSERPEKRVPMSRLRAKIAERLLQAQHNAAMLTTFNQVNLQAVIDLRKKYQESFTKTHAIRLGFMSFFTKAVVEALKRFPTVNASIDGTDVIYHGYYDIGIAVSTERGLVVPVVRDADQMSMAALEHKISQCATKARDGKLTMEEITGGTFTITNGGVFGSLLATPILNPPQSGILGMHTIEERAMVENGQVVVRPMMYVALTYDHRIIDGKESVQFLLTVKNLLEDPARLLLEV